MSSSFLIDLKNVMGGGVSIAPQTYSSAGAKTGSAIDMQLTEGPVHAFVITGDCGDANSNFVVKLQESDTTTSGDFADISGAVGSTYTGATAGDSLMVAVSTNLRLKRYVRAVVTIATTGTASVIIAVACLARLKEFGGAGNYTTVT